MSRLDYIEKLGADNPKKVTRTDFQLNLHSLEKQPFYNPFTSIDKAKVQPLSVNDLLGVYQKDPNQIVGYLNLARSLNVSRARKKKMGKFKAEICRKKIPALWPLRERIWVLSRSLQRGEKIEKNSVEINLLQKDTSNLPFFNIILSAKKQNKEDGILFQETLVDTGSEINILTLKMLENFKIPKNLIQKL